ncbi:MAG: excinuclease ABC subunit UvrC, partial [Oscillospiraceae bacterium]|nr:excinuclease ABC subunit UvrC [Oscillospiraceae bacterium]
EETHRYAIEYHRSLRGKRVSQSSLDRIEGVGPKRRESLLKTFGSIRAIKEADMESLLLVLPRNAAAAVYDHFHKEDGK